jgi:hypothetical protein
LVYRSIYRPGKKNKGAMITGQIFELISQSFEHTAYKNATIILAYLSPITDPVL